MPFPPRFPSLAVLAFAVLMTAGCDDKKQSNAPRPSGPVEVSAITVEPGRVALTTELPGRTTAFRVAEVRPQVNGIILKRLFQEGSEVKAGQQLYQIDPATYQAAVNSAQADLVKARASLKSVEAKASRYEDLVRINAVSRQDYDDAIASLDQAKAQILVAEAAVQTARISLGYTKVFAPISGRIGKSSVTEGALVTANQTTSLSTITQLDPIFVDVSQSSSELLRLRRTIAAGGNAATATAPVTLTLDGTSQPYDLPGRLEFSDVTVDQSTGAVQVRAVFPNPRHELYPGLFVRARIEQGVKEQSILVPQKSLVRSADGSASVWVVGADNKVAPRPVTVGQAVGDSWIVEQGLASGDQVVTEGLQKIRPGAEVRVAPAKAPPAAPPAAAR
ncbi:efflux RND transporter periplasmic adaptor subunit [Magnetospirillum molischianum]|uniref:Putative component of multidrug efflux pump, acrB/acrD/acrF family n=1 Tax=Magnetospirillum molischianum DSM 120 TaxID=1150626 RepID=H8FNA0_MAGML|nr:efflux RND transporter periplasmic adaptor subunit [Magnetospirillum molischianum]CCG39838.1 Putative component of multidrug efflux pump, acrB/acrD/acrF family [Magnetospirillum molischianum DSM 120]